MDNSQKSHNSEFTGCDNEYSRTMEGLQGEITFKSNGFKHYKGKPRMILGSHQIETIERGESQLKLKKLSNTWCWL